MLQQYQSKLYPTILINQIELHPIQYLRKDQ